MSAEWAHSIDVAVRIDHRRQDHLPGNMRQLLPIRDTAMKTKKPRLPNHSSECTTCLSLRGIVRTSGVNVRDSTPPNTLPVPSMKPRGSIMAGSTSGVALTQPSSRRRVTKTAGVRFAVSSAVRDRENGRSGVRGESERGAIGKTIDPASAHMGAAFRKRVGEESVEAELWPYEPTRRCRK